MSSTVVTDVIALTEAEFIATMKAIADVKQWRTPSAEALSLVFYGFPKNSATNQPFVDASDFYEAVNRLTEATGRTVPSDIKAIYEQVRRERVKALTEASHRPQLPPKPQTMPDEYYRFARLGRQLKAMREQGQRFIPWAEYDARWNAELTEEDYRQGARLTPETLCQSIGIKGSARPGEYDSAKEQDAVWMPEPEAGVWM